MAATQDNQGSPLDPSDDPISDSGSEYVPSEDSEISFDWENFSPHTPSDVERNDSPSVIHQETDYPRQSLQNNKCKRIRRGHRCLYCDCDVKDFARHLERHHDDEIEVQRFMSLKKGSMKRKSAIAKLRREGDFCSSNVIPVLHKADKRESDYIACIHCRGYYTSKSLRRHVKKCSFNPDPSKPCKSQSQGHTLMAGPFGPEDPLRISGILNMMKPDEVSMVAKRDNLICEVARRYIKRHKEKHLLLVAKRHMRRLARLLISVRKLDNNPQVNLFGLLVPNKFKVLVRATKEIAEYDSKERCFKSPSLALQMGTLLKSAVNTAYSSEVQSANCSRDRLEELKALNVLIETDWADEISSEAGQNLNVNKFNKPTLIPMAEDIKKFEAYLNSILQNAKELLVEDPSNKKAFRDLVDGVFCRVLLFNRRRVGELQRMTLSAYLKNKLTNTSGFEKVLTPTEKILYKSLKRVVIRGKRGRGVPVLFEKSIVEYIELLIKHRHNFNLDDNIYLFANPGTNNSITGYKVMLKHSRLAIRNHQRASLLSSTRLRKHLATMTQIYHMGKNDLEQLATFMGHTEKTHSSFYRLPDDVYQTAKVSKLLLLSKNDHLEAYKGKSLDEIEIDFDISEEESDDDKAEEQTYVESDLQTNVTDSTENEGRRRVVGRAGKKRCLVPWTAEQKKITEAFFKKHINRRKPPKKFEVVQMVERYPQVFQNKTWPVIKVYVCNKFRK
ncbi:unnamed protein product [Callosobruchus maculatus]|uniref:Uncharacterized protein n=1 Tax=Callosobruchus maculatus TaxID=64391 RepID=A0A653CHN7_CALMS|nr:unnamed protein product [Callosobruchus maculatus]